jgi:hypothetical protein
MTTRSQGNYENMATKGTSLAKGPASIVGMILLAYGVTGLIFGGNSFDSNPLDGTVNGDTWLGIEGNGWSNLLAIGAGGILMFGAQLHWSAKTTALIVGLVFAACAVIALIDGSDVLGIFAANNATKLAWAITAAVLIVIALLPRVGRRREPATAADDDIDRRREDRFDRDREVAPRGGAVSERRVEHRS